MNSPRLIVVEDDPVVAEDLRHIVERSGSLVVGIADTAELALEIARQTEPALALVDIRLAGNQDGIEAAESLRQLGVGVLFLTAHSDKSTLRRATDTEPVGFLTKPVTEGELLRGIAIGLRLVSTRRREHRERRHLLGVLSCLNEGVAIFEADGRLRFSNPSLARLLPEHTTDQLTEIVRRAQAQSEPLRLDRELEASCIALDALERRALIVRSRNYPDPAGECLSMCSYCRRVRGEHSSWQPIETVLATQFGLLVSHGLCEHCLSRYFESEADSNLRSDAKVKPKVKE